MEVNTWWIKLSGFINPYFYTGNRQESIFPLCSRMQNNQINLYPSSELLYIVETCDNESSPDPSVLL